MFLFHIIFLDPDYVVRIRIRIIQLTEFSARWMRAYTCPGLTLPIRGVGVMGGGGGGDAIRSPPHSVTRPIILPIQNMPADRPPLKQ